jgi:hypothetical protein
MVGDTDDHRLWRASRDLWVAATEHDLAALDEHSRDTFSRATSPPPGEGTIAEDLPVELECVRQGMAFLIGLRAQTQRDENAPAREGDRRSTRLGP